MPRLTFCETKNCQNGGGANLPSSMFLAAAAGGSAQKLQNRRRILSTIHTIKQMLINTVELEYLYIHSRLLKSGFFTEPNRCAISKNGRCVFDDADDGFNTILMLQWPANRHSADTSLTHADTC